MKTIVGVSEITDEIWKTVGAETGGTHEELRAKLLEAVRKDFRDTIPMMTEKDISAMVSGECQICGGNDEGFCVAGCPGGDYLPPERCRTRYPTIDKLLEKELS